MRSRFAAFVIGNVPYLFRTLHPEHEDRARKPDVVHREMREACNAFRYMGLTVMDREVPDASGTARVLFLVRLFERGTDRSFVELSDFKNDGTGWRYVRGDTVPARQFGAEAPRLTIATFRQRARDAG
jgi:SEC-C motif-containing protein